MPRLGSPSKPKTSQINKPKKQGSKAYSSASIAMTPGKKGKGKNA